MTRQFVRLLAGVALGLSALAGAPLALAQCEPSPELCDGVDNDCDGSVDEVTGTRFVAVNGSDDGGANLCTSSGTPCATITHASLAACVNETISVAPGTYVQDAVIAKQGVVVDSSSSSLDTRLQGTGAGDVVTILASGVTWNGIEVSNGPAGACVRVGDPAHPEVRNISIQNNPIQSCAVGILFDSTGSPPSGGWNRVLDTIVRNHLGNGQPNSGVGVLFLNGSGKTEIKLGELRDNEGPAVRVVAPPPGGASDTIYIVGMTISGNGSGVQADGRSALEFAGSGNIVVEGNDIRDHVGLSGPGDGRAITLDGVTAASILCNRVRDGEDGVLALNGSSGISVLSNRFTGNSGTALFFDGTSGAGSIVNQDVFSGNGVGLDNQNSVTLDARLSWWGAASGPAPGGAGDLVTGAVDTSDFWARAAAPLLVKAPNNTGWDWPVAACYTLVGQAASAAVAGDLLLVGAGRYVEHAVIDGKQLDIEGIAGGSACSPSQMWGQQSGGSHLPTLRVRNVSGMSIHNMSIDGAGQGTICGQGTGDEINLDLQNVDNSRFTNLCLWQHGVTGARIYGDSDDNLFEKISISGMIRDHEGDDLCGARAREGFLIDGGPACEGGPGAFADRNRIVDVQTFHNSRAITVKLARETEISGSLIHGVPSAQWDDGAFSTSVWVRMSDDTRILDNYDVGNRGMTDAIRIQGRTASDCATENPDSDRTTIRGNAIDMVENAGYAVRLYRADGDPGDVTAVDASCNGIRGAWQGIRLETIDPASSFGFNDIVADTSGLVNLSATEARAENNWWGDPSGPSGSGPGTGTSVSGSVDFTPWLASSAFDDADLDGYSECDGDADDADPAIKPFDDCDGTDNDGDGSVDEDFASEATTCGLGACASTGATSCVDGVVSDSCLPGTPAADDASCNAIDDDCDGFVDEDYPATPTECGVGACSSTGALACIDGAVQDTCTPGAPAADDAACNAIDDDCDGSVDEDFITGPTTCGAGACASTGAGSCEGGVYVDTCVPGTPAPSDTTCDNIDDNCDGFVDEGFEPQATSCGVGVCARSGVTSCVDGVVLDSCSPGAPNFPIDENCDGLDDDCDGSTDEEFVPTTSACGRGVCSSNGSITCDNGVINDTCVPGEPLSPVDETCDAIDDDCDGSADEDFITQPTTCGEGACASTGELTCAAGVLSDSCEPLGSGFETCNGLDDDCDGTVDNGFELGGSCSAGVGACESTGTIVCTADGAGTECDAVPGTPAPDDSLCNAIDDDCDGSTDEEYASQATACGTGECAASGATSCVGGVVEDSCTPGVPSAELCDGLDNDCDDAIDNGFELGGSCSAGVGACESTGTVVCTADGAGTECDAVPGTPTDETCNGTDDNCDGIIDNAEPPSGGTPLSLTRGPSTTELSWASIPLATFYDVVRGGLTPLVSSGGDFSSATDDCLANDDPDTTTEDPASPGPGQGFWYLVRGGNCGGNGTYADSGPGQVGDRDGGIAASLNACP